MFRSATFKLTVYYLGIVMAISLLFSGALYHVAAGELRRGLNAETSRITRQFPVFQDAPGLMRPAEDVNAASRRVVWRLAYVNVLVLVGAGFASYMLARRTLQPIEEATAQQSRFTSDVSHELRTPLTALRMESEVALLDPKTPAKELRATLQSNIEEVSKMETLINNLLRLTKLDSAQMQQSFTAVSLRSAAELAVEHTERQASERNITVLLKKGDATVQGDADSIKQLIIILLENAIKYSPNNSAVSLKIVDGPEPSINIADKGQGIERDALEHVFDRFYRADASRTGSEGFGLGLSIAKMIADVHEATITLSSKPGHGTTALVNFTKS